jgi:RimJ/RimL family protein N-acetyltransferase
MVTVRRPVAADAERYLFFLARLDSQTPFLLWEPGERRIDAEALRRRFSTLGEDAELLIADAEEQVVGFVSAHRGATRRLRHRADFSMGLLEEFQGQGLGGRLLEELEAWARGMGLLRLELTVMAHNGRARRLYERHGYLMEGIKRGAIRVRGEPVDEVLMGKSLDALTTPQISQG